MTHKDSGRLGERGFGLFDFLVLLVVLGVAVVLLIGVTGRVRSEANVLHCQSNLKVLAIALHTYADSENNFFPHRVEGNKIGWHRNAKLRQFLHLPVDSDTAPNELLCPDRPARRGLSRTYGQNFTGIPPAQLEGDKLPYLVINRSMVEEPSAKVHLVDASDWQVTAQGADYEEHWDVNGERNGSEGGAWNVVAYRHQQSANVVHYDGGVRNYPKQQLYPRDEDEKVEYALLRRLWYVYGYVEPTSKDAAAEPSPAATPDAVNKP